MVGSDAKAAGNTVVSAESLSEMLTPVAGTQGAFRISFTERAGYGLGYIIDSEVSRSGLLIAQVDIGRGWTSLIAAIPDARIGIVVLTNGDTMAPLLYEHVLCEWLAWSESKPSEHCGNLYDVYTMSADGSNPRRATSTLGREYFPQWSPDGGRIAFSRSHGGETNAGFYTMRLDGTDERLLARESQIGSLSPDGQTFAFEAFAGGSVHILLAPVSGRPEPRQLTVGEHPSIRPTWSPDGKRIAFLRAAVASLWDVSRRQWDLWVVDIESGQARLLAPIALALDDWSSTLPSQLDWSPDGASIVFVSQHDIYVVSVGDGSTRRLTTDSLGNRDPAWSPDGKSIAFARAEVDQHDIYVMNADGTNPQLLTAHPADELTPAWSPDGTRIAFMSNRVP
jgi:Tol biopolymer transport system component